MQKKEIKSVPFRVKIKELFFFFVLENKALASKTKHLSLSLLTVLQSNYRFRNNRNV